MKNKSLAIIIIAMIALGGWWFVRAVQSRIPDNPDRSVAYAIISRDHIAVGASHEDYNSNPPSSGAHYGEPAKGGFYDVTETAPLDEALIHNLEHGEIWIAYRPSISTTTKDALKKFAARSLIVATSRAANDADIALVAWGRVDKFDLTAPAGLDETRVNDFITRYLNHGPEKVPASEHLRK